MFERFEDELRERDVRGGWCDLNERERDALADALEALRRVIRDFQDLSVRYYRASISEGLDALNRLDGAE